MDKMNKKGSITARTLEKLGIGSFGFRSNSESSVKSESKSSSSDSPGTSTVNTITAGELHLPVEIISRYSTENLESLIKSHDNKSSSSVFYLDESPTMVTTATDVEASENKNMVDKKKRQPPDGTFEYTVKDRDTLEKIAAHYDTTPSELKKLNKLISAVIFAGQVLHIPDKDYEHPVVGRTSSSASSEGNGSQQQSDSVFGSPQDKPKMVKNDVPLVKSGNSSPTKVPGHAERQISMSPPLTAFDYEVMTPHKLSVDEVQQLDQDCLERFIKLKVKHITDGQIHKVDPDKGVVKGTLLVTPNAVMFDPNVSDPLVVEHGSEKYGMIAPMDLIISAAMYHDIAAMKMRGKKMEDGSIFPKPEIYHDTSCPMAKDKLQSSQATEQSKYSTSSLTDNIKNILRNPLTKSESVCSCGKGVSSDKSFPSVDTPGSSKTEQSPTFGDFSLDKGRYEEAESFLTDDSKVDDNVFSEEYDNHNNSNVGSVKGVDDDSDKIECDTDRDGIKTSPGLGQKTQKKLSVSFSLPESDSPNVKDNLSPNLETLVDIDDSIEAKAETNTTSDTEKTIKEGEETVGEEGSSPNGDKETRIGNIVYLPVEEDANGKVTVQSVEKTANTLSKLSVDEFSEISKSDTNLVDKSLNLESRDVEKTRSASTSSLGPFSPTPHLNAFVNYATGFFQKHASDSSIKDIKDALVDSLPDLKKSQDSTKQSEQALLSQAKSDIPTVASAPAPSGRRGKMSRHGNKPPTASSSSHVAVENAVSLDEKPDLLTMDYEQFAPKKSVAYPDPPLYLCLRLGTPQNKNIFHNYTIESYGKSRKKSEYWFSIPRDKVDHLYAFFVQWTPEIYGDEEDITPERRGFVVIEDDNGIDDMEMLDEHFGPNSSFQKDWEIVSKEIISQSEAVKRRSIVFDEPMPLPDLIGESTILTDAHISVLSQELPGRTIGYPWTLIYSTDKHGFSLKTLYRDMAGLDSPILIAVKDTSDNIFGAMTSCELKYSDSFYGNGETFLFTFFPEFKVFHWTGENNFFIKGNQESLSIGAGQGINGLWFDEDLYHGRTNRCETFDNDILTDSEDFVVKGVEAWAFIWE